MAKELFSHPWAAELNVGVRITRKYSQHLRGGSSLEVSTPTAMLQDTAKGPGCRTKQAASNTWPIAEPVLPLSPPEFNVL